MENAPPGNPEPDPDTYELISPGIQGDVEFYKAEAARTAGGRVLELGCGAGRVAIPLAIAGASVVGIDLSPGMIALAKRRVAALPADVRARVDLSRGDMRDLSLGRLFDLVLVPYRTFMYLLDVEEQRATLTRAREHLVQGGRLVLDVFDPDPASLAEGSRPGGAPFRKAADVVIPGRFTRLVLTTCERVDLALQTFEEDWVLEEVDDAGQASSRRWVTRTLRYTHRFELLHLLELTGFRVEALHGDFRGGEPRPGGELVVVARASGPAAE